MPPIILDSILLLLLTLGSFEPSTLRSFKRFSAFDDDDLALLKAFLQGRNLLFTPHTLTELLNLANSLSSGTRIAFAQYLREFLPAAEERQLQATELIKTPAFVYFGITDAALSILSKKPFYSPRTGVFATSCTGNGAKRSIFLLCAASANSI